MEEKSSTSVALLIVRGAGHIRLPHRHLLDLHVVIVEPAAEFAVKVPGYLLRRGGDLQKRRKLVEIFMVEGLEQLPGLFLDEFEVYTEPGLVQFAGGDGNLNLPVVAVEIFAIPLVVH